MAYPFKNRRSLSKYEFCEFFGYIISGIICAVWYFQNSYSMQYLNPLFKTGRHLQSVDKPRGFSNWIETWLLKRLSAKYMDVIITRATQLILRRVQNFGFIISLGILKGKTLIYCLICFCVKKLIFLSVSPVNAQ